MVRGAKLRRDACLGPRFGDGARASIILAGVGLCKIFAKLQNTWASMHRGGE